MTSFRPEEAQRTDTLFNKSYILIYTKLHLNLLSFFDSAGSLDKNIQPGILT